MKKMPALVGSIFLLVIFMAYCSETTPQVLIDEKSIVKVEIFKFDQSFKFVTSNMLNSGKWWISNIRNYRFQNNSLEEIREVFDLHGNAIDTIYIPTFLLHDTTYCFFLDLEKYPPNAPLNSNDWSYSVKKIRSNLFVLKKKNISNSRNIERYYYDSTFRILNIYLEMPGEKIKLAPI